MGVLVYVLGRTGTGKSFSMKNFPSDKLAVINVESKILPFRGSAKIETTNTDDSEKILKALEIYSKDYKSIVVDDFQYLMSNEFMRRATEKGYDKFTEIAAHAWDIPNKVKDLPNDVIVYIMCHTDVDSEGTERLKTIGKLLDEKIYLEGMSTIVLKTVVSDGKYTFTTQNNGKDTVKSPADMFPGYQIDNDLWYVDQKIREYYGLGNTLTVDELAEADEDVTVTVDKPEKKRRTRNGETKEEKSAETPKKEEEVEKPKRRTRRPDAKAEADEKLEQQMLESEGIEELPTRKERTEESNDSAEPVEPAEEAKPRRRRRRTE